MAQAVTPSVAPPPLSIPEVASFWGKFSKVFHSHGDMLRGAGFTLLQQSNAYQACQTLEVGCGLGETAEQWSKFAGPDSELTSTDLTSEMIVLAQERVQHPRLKFTQANAEHFAESSFDAYLAVHVLHLTTEPDKMLKEALRVLKPGCIAAFSVWGRPENTSFFTIMSTTLQDINVPSVNPARRTNFHLCDLALLRRMALAAGFAQVVAYYSACPLPVLLSGEAKADILLRGPGQEAQLASMTEQQRAIWRKKIVDKIDADIANGGCLSNEIAVLVVRK